MKKKLNCVIIRDIDPDPYGTGGSVADPLSFCTDPDPGWEVECGSGSATLGSALILVLDPDPQFECGSVS